MVEPNGKEPASTPPEPSDDERFDHRLINRVAEALTQGGYREPTEPAANERAHINFVYLLGMLVDVFEGKTESVPMAVLARQFGEMQQAAARESSVLRDLITDQRVTIAEINRALEINARAMEIMT